MSENIQYLMDNIWISPLRYGTPDLNGKPKTCKRCDRQIGDLPSYSIDAPIELYKNLFRECSPPNFVKEAIDKNYTTVSWSWHKNDYDCKSRC